jgi:hypothetical protein
MGRTHVKGTTVVVRGEVRASDRSDPQTAALLTAIEQRTATPTS